MARDHIDILPGCDQQNRQEKRLFNLFAQLNLYQQFIESMPIKNAQIERNIEFSF
jgi:hypothetical protein